MEKHRCLEKMMILFLIGLISISCFCKATIEDGALETYIVFVQRPQGFASSIQPSDLSKWYRSFLPDSAFSSTEDRMVFSYSNVVTGFAAKLTAQEVKAIEEKEGFLSAFPDKVLPFLTTHTPSFLGLHQNFGLWNISNYGKGQIIGLIDSGIAPDHPSFSDKGMPPPPAKWKGKCEFNETVCNNKLIGARNFGDPGKPPSDDYMHGTHTAGTAAGSPVPGANFFGQANGTAMGIAPLAHLAMYKCGVTDCTDSTVLAAMDAAIEEGVDVLSLSLALPLRPFFNDSIAIAAFGAIQKGIFVSCSAGNSGPRKGSVRNDAPWILTVGASTVDRAIRATVLLGNQVELNGQSLFQPKDFPSTLLPLDYPGVNGNQSLAFCLPGSLKNVDIKDKIVLCNERAAAVEQGKEVRDNGGAGMIITNGQFSDEDIEPEYHVLPASHVSYKAGLAIKEYINSTASPMATILFKGTVIGIPDAPQVASFSSRGPSLRASGILKPDIIGPGVSVLAAWPVSYDNTSNSLSRFSMISGTSMSCPHLSGIAALLRSAHLDWSPAAIKSAIMTTADVNNLGGKPIYDQQFVPATVFDMGAGHVNPSRANDPGLVYDVQPDDYVSYLCGLNISDKEVALVVQHQVTCPKESVIPGSQLNYPSFSVNLGSTPQTHTRTVTNVGQPNSVYTLEIVALQGVDVKVTPDTINFGGLNQKATYSVTFSRTPSANGTFAQGHLSWKSDKYTVRSPIAVTFA